MMCPDRLPAHVLAVHTPLAHTRPQPPQLFGSLVVSVQIPPQSTVGSVHTSMASGDASTVASGAASTVASGRASAIGPSYRPASTGTGTHVPWLCVKPDVQLSPTSESKQATRPSAAASATT